MQYDTQHHCRCSLFRRFFRTWQSRCVSWTKNAVDFARTEEDVVADSVPMHEIMSIAAITEQPSPESLWTASQEDLGNQSSPALNDEQRSNDGQLFVNEQGDCTFTAGNSDSDTRHCTMLMANAPPHPSSLGCSLLPLLARFRLARVRCARQPVRDHHAHYHHDYNYDHGDDR